jgi:cysteine desulfuration protein SufE
MSRLDEIVDEFAGLDQRERLELLLDFAERLPPLPPEYQSRKREHRVHECQTEVYLWVEVHNGRVAIHAWVAPEAPTVKGFVALLAEAFTGCTPEEVLAVKPDLLNRLGLLESLGMVRMRGLSSVFKRIHEALSAATAS